MHTSWSSHGLSDFPIASTLCLVQEGVIGTGWLWELSPKRGLVQRAFLASSGIVNKVSVQIPGVALIRMVGLVSGLACRGLGGSGFPAACRFD